MYQWKNMRDDSNNVKETYGRVYLNLCRRDDLGFTREEKLAVLRHEKAHGHGWIHGEGTRPRPTRPTTATTTSTASRGRSSAVSSSLAPSSAQTEFDRPEG